MEFIKIQSQIKLLSSPQESSHQLPDEYLIDTLKFINHSKLHHT